MKLTPQQLYDKHPEVLDIANRLEQSEREVAESNASREKSNLTTVPLPGEEHLTVAQRSVKKKHPDHAVIARVCRNGQWENTVYQPRPGKKEFEEKLGTVLSREPDGITIRVYPGARTSGGPDWEKTIWLDAEKEQTKDPLGTTETDNEAPVKEVELMISNFQKDMEKQREQLVPNAKNNGEDLRYKLMEKTHEMQMKDMKNVMEINTLKVAHNEVVKDLKAQIKEDAEYIKQLEEELDESDRSLNGLQEEVKKKKEPDDLVTIGGKILAKGIAGALIKFPELTEAISGLDKDAQKRIWDKYKDKTGEAEGGNESNFELIQDDYAGLDPTHAEMCKNAHNFLKAIDFESMKMIYFLFEYCTTDEGKLDAEKLKKAYNLLFALKADDQAQEKEKQTAAA